MHNIYWIFPWVEDDIQIPLANLLRRIKANPNKKIVIFNPEEHDVFWHELRDNRKAIEKTLKKFNSTIEVWLGVFDFRLEDSKRIKFHNWPLHLLYSTCTTEGMQTQEEKNIDKLGVSLNNVPHNFRCEFVDKLAKYKILDSCYFTWHEDKIKKLPYEFQYWKPVKSTLEEPEDLGFINGAWDQYHVPAEFHNGLIHFINESTVDKLDISEKTWLAILHKKPFIIAGAKDIHKVLEDLGFKNYTDFFDFDFDNFESYSDRVESICEQSAQYLGNDYQSMYDNVSPTITHNYNRLMEIFTTNEGVPKQLFEYLDNPPDYLNGPKYHAIKSNLDKQE